jgi:hypothetical protein
MTNSPIGRRGKPALRLVLLSDTHQLHREVDVPVGDIFIHARDFTMFSENALYKGGIGRSL